jgi:hypothetical protein
VAEAIREGCDQVVFLDAVERRWLEELGGMHTVFTQVTPRTTAARTQASSSSCRAIAGPSRIDQQHFTGLLIQSHRAVFNAMGHDDEFPLFDDLFAIPKLHEQASPVHEEHLVIVLPE